MIFLVGHDKRPRIGDGGDEPKIRRGPRGEGDGRGRPLELGNRLLECRMPAGRSR